MFCLICNIPCPPLKDVVSFLLDHYDVILTAIGFLAYAVKATKWGKANAKALETVAGVVEELGHAEVKAAVKAKSADLPKIVVDAIADAVNTVDPEKPTPKSSDVVIREAGRGLVN